MNEHLIEFTNTWTIERSSNERLKERMPKQIDWSNVRLNECTCEQTNDWTNIQTNEQLNECTSERIYKPPAERIYEQTNDWTNIQTNEQLNECTTWWIPDLTLIPDIKQKQNGRLSRGFRWQAPFFAYCSSKEAIMCVYVLQLQQTVPIPPNMSICGE